MIPEPIWISGRIIDQSDRPVRHAPVKAFPQIPHRGLASVLGEASRTVTDESGWFHTAVPFAGIRYSVETPGLHWFEKPMVIAGRSATPVTVRLSEVSPLRRIGGTVVDEDHQPVSNALVEFVAKTGQTGSTVTDASGHFSFEIVGEGFDGVAIIARANGLVGGMRADREDHKLLVQKPGRVTGALVAQDTRLPIAGATVILVSRFLEGFCMKTRSDQDGVFGFSGVPEGLYVVGAESDTYFQRDTDSSKAPVRDGQAVTSRIEMEPSAKLAGRVTDRTGLAVAGALVGTRCSHSRRGWNDYRHVETDQDGEFTMYTGPVEDSLQVEIFSARHGAASVDVEGLLAGAEARLTVRLAGMFRLRGVVVDPKGRPIAGVRCVAAVGSFPFEVTDEHGRFDFGLIPVSSQWGPRQRSVTFRPPRSYDPFTRVSRNERMLPATQPALSVNYHFQSANYDAVADEDVKLNVTLKPAELITFRGRVFDRDHRAVAGAFVHLFSGIPVNWHDIVHPGRWGNHSSRDLQLSSTVTDTDGRWMIQVVRETADSLLIGYGSNEDPGTFTVVAEAPDGTDSHTLRRITMGQDTSESRVDLTLDAAFLPPSTGK